MVFKIHFLRPPAHILTIESVQCATSILAHLANPPLTEQGKEPCMVTTGSSPLGSSQVQVAVGANCHNADSWNIFFSKLNYKIKLLNYSWHFIQIIPLNGMSIWYSIVFQIFFIIYLHCINIFSKTRSLRVKCKWEYAYNVSYISLREMPLELCYVTRLSIPFNIIHCLYLTLDFYTP